MTQEETLKRIDDEAETRSDFFSPTGQKDGFYYGFIAGAKSERNKVLDEAIERLQNAAETSDEIFGVVFMCCIQELTSLKVDL